MSTTEIKRYDVVGMNSEYSCESCSLQIISLENETGKYVKFDDHEDEVDRLKELIREQQETIKDLDEYRVMWENLTY